MNTKEVVTRLKEIFKGLQNPKRERPAEYDELEEAKNNFLVALSPYKARIDTLLEQDEIEAIPFIPIVSDTRDRHGVYNSNFMTFRKEVNSDGDTVVRISVAEVYDTIQPHSSTDRELYVTAWRRDVLVNANLDEVLNCKEGYDEGYHNDPLSVVEELITEAPMDEIDLVITLYETTEMLGLFANRTDITEDTVREPYSLPPS